MLRWRADTSASLSSTKLLKMHESLHHATCLEPQEDAGGCQGSRIKKASGETQGVGITLAIHRGQEGLSLENFDKKSAKG